MIVLNINPVGPDRTLDTYDFFLETPEPDAKELDAIRYLDEVLQVEDINLVDSVQRGMSTAAFAQGRIVHDPEHLLCWVACQRDTRQKDPQSDARQNIVSACQRYARHGQAPRRPLCSSDHPRASEQSGTCLKASVPPCACATEFPENPAPHHRV